MIHYKPGNLFGNGQALSFVSIQNGVGCPLVQSGAEQPGQIHGVGNAGIHAVAGIRHPDMGRIAAQKYPVFAKTISHQASSEPVFSCQDVVFELIIYTENGSDGAVAINRFKVGFIFA